MKRSVFVALSLLVLTLACTGGGGNGRGGRAGGGGKKGQQVEVPTGVRYTPAGGAAILGANMVLIGPPPGSEGEASDRALSVEAARQEFADLGVQRFRQLAYGDLGWEGVQPDGGAYQFDGPDTAIKSFPNMAVPTLFGLKFANPTPPWRMVEGQPFEKACGSDALAYVAAVVDRYKDDVEYWEIGNEMDHWRGADPNGERADREKTGKDKKPANYPRDGYSPQEQGRFLAEVAKVVREHDPNAKIVMPGMGGIDSYPLETWLPGLIEGAGKDTFDVVNFHMYTSWDKMAKQHTDLNAALESLGIADKAVWLTETGCTSDATLDERTNYPNSEDQQAADVFRRMGIGYAFGDDGVFWHTFVDSSGKGNPWRGYGLISLPDQTHKKSWYAYRLFAHEVVPFTAATALEAGDRYVLEFEREGGKRWIVFGSGSYSPPKEATRMTTTVFTGDAPWGPIAGDIQLTDVPILLATEK